jgi:hypothetical protein
MTRRAGAEKVAEAFERTGGPAAAAGAVEDLLAVGRGYSALRTDTERRR